MPGFLMDIVKNTRKYISEKLGFGADDFGDHISASHFGSSRKRSFETNDFGCSPKLRRISNSYLREPGSIFMPESLASDSNKTRITHFMETLSDVKRINDADLFPNFDKTRRNNTDFENYSRRIDQALKQHQPLSKPLPYAFSAPSSHRASIPDLHPIQRSNNRRRSALARPRLNGGGISKRHSILNNTQMARDPRVPNLMHTLFSEPVSRMPKPSTLHLQQQQNINSIVKKFERNANRQKYEQLLQTLVPQLYSIPTQTSVSSLKNRRKSLLPPTEIIDLDDEADQQPSTSQRRSKIREEIDTIDLSGDENLENIMQSYLKNQMARQVPPPSSDEPIEIIEIPDVEPVNTLKDKLENQPNFKKDLVANVDTHYSLRYSQRSEQINDEKENLRKLKENTVQQEKFIVDKFKDFVIDDIIVLDEEDEKDEVDEYPPLTKDHHNLLKHALVGRREEVIVSKFNMNITRADLNTLVGSNWLNDEVINFYMNLLVERSEKRADDGYPKVYSMNTFFIPKLLQSGHLGLKRWTRKVDIFSYDVIPVPVHVGEVHWCMAIIHMRNKTIKYYDSMGKPNERVLDALEQYLKDECMDKKKEKFDMGGWEKVSVPDCPRQMNGSDCGVFSCMNAEFVTRDSNITFSQQHMPYFRSKMVCEIAAGALWL